ncbi:hypothetical protein ERHA55_52920 (plasmid) [Erwinia rhapontici]|nr:hypothetical protein ERHA55_52920 [Erwinia rhapontici]
MAYAGRGAAQPTDWHVLKSLALKAEAAKFDLIFMADKLSIDDVYGDSVTDAVRYRVTERPEPFTVLSALGAVTEKSAGRTISSSVIQPFAAARTLATLITSRGDVPAGM